ncbi:SRPBCC family protein [soil metagenome]
MQNTQLTNAPVMKTAMLVRKPMADVFQAFIDPEITTQFWFTKSNGKLEPDKHVQWDWEMYGVSAQVFVKAIEANKRILIEWGVDGEHPTTAEWIFTSHGDNATFVSITETGFVGDADKLVSQALDSTGGFTLVLAGLKALLEHNVTLNLVADRFPGESQ